MKHVSINNDFSHSNNQWWLNWTSVNVSWRIHRRLGEKFTITYFVHTFRKVPLSQHSSQYSLLASSASLLFGQESSTFLNDSCPSDRIAFSSCDNLGMNPNIISKVSASLLMVDDIISVKSKRRGGRWGKLFMSKRIRKITEFCLDHIITIASM